MVKYSAMTSLDILSFVSSDDALQMLCGWLRTERQRLADLPTTLKEELPKKPVLRVRMRKGEVVHAAI